MTLLTVPYAGTAITTTATFADPSGTATDPTTVELIWEDGDGNVTTWTYGDGDEITRISTGVYQAIIPTTTNSGSSPATWTVQWVGTEACAAVNAMTFRVQNPPLTSS